MEKNKYYCLLASVGVYQGTEQKNLPSWQMDLKLMCTALTEGLKITPDRIRIIGENGAVSSTNLARSLNDFSKLITDEDGFIFYFSGHGKNGNISLSDGKGVSIQSLLKVISDMKAKSKIVILDCCYAGEFQMDGARQMSFEEAIGDFAGSGMAVFASSASDEASWLGVGGNHSLYTGILTTAMTLERKVRNGRVSLADINEEVKHITTAWNRENENKIQHPIYRASMGGTIFFQVEEYKPYETRQIYIDKKKYTVQTVKPISSIEEKRLAAMVLIKGECDMEDLAKISKEIALLIRHAKVYSSKRSERRFGRSAAKSVWCYFGHDESDMVNHRYFARSIWCCDETGKKRYFTEGKHGEIINGVYVMIDRGYEIVKEVQQVTVSKEEFKRQTKKLLSKTISMAEQFITDIEEIDNRTKTIKEVREEYQSWIQEVNEEYYKLTESPMAPDELHDWFKQVEALAGCVLNMALQLKSIDTFDGSARWLLRSHIRSYYETLEKLRKLEEL